MSKLLNHYKNCEWENKTKFALCSLAGTTANNAFVWIQEVEIDILVDRFSRKAETKLPKTDSK